MSNPTVVIPPAPKDDFISIHVYDNSHGVYMDAERGTLIVPEPAELFSEHVVNDFIAAQIGRDTESGAQPGIFWVEGHLSRDEIKSQHKTQLGLALQGQLRWFQRLVERADMDWSRTGRIDHVSELQKSAALALNFQRDWLSVTGGIGNSRCVACSTILPDPPPPICPACRCVLDKERYSKFEFAK